MQSKALIIEDDFPIDCLSMCPLCNTPVTENPVIIKAATNGQMTVAHKSCFEDYQINPTDYFLASED